MPQEVEEFRLRSAAVNRGAVSNVFSGLAFAAEFACDFDANRMNLDVALLGFAVEVIAIASGEGQKEEFASVDAGAHTLEFWVDGEGLFAIACCNRDGWDPRQFSTRAEMFIVTPIYLLDGVGFPLALTGLSGHRRRRAATTVCPTR